MKKTCCKYKALLHTLLLIKYIKRMKIFKDLLNERTEHKNRPTFTIYNISVSGNKSDSAPIIEELRL